MNPWIEVIGRFHPMLVHLPIGLLVGLAALEVLTLRQPAARARSVLAGLTGLAAAAAATAGWILGHAPDRARTDVLERHQWLGLALATTCLVLALLARRAALRPAAYRLVLAGALLLVLPTGHLGATMTLGEDFLFEPLHRAAAEPVTAASMTAAATTGAATTGAASAYADVIAPILQARCSACHNATRHKGNLVLITPEGLRAGGRNGPVLTVPSELLRRVQLPLDDEDHMPPPEKPQPSADELAALEAWITAGAPFEGPVPGLHASAATTPAPVAVAEPDTPAVPPADPAALAAVRDALLHVEPAEPGDNLLWVDAAAVAGTLTDARTRELLNPLREQLAELSLARAPVTDALGAMLADCPRLRRLDLSGTAFTWEGLRALGGHESLQELVLVRTQLGDAGVDALLALPALRRVHLWEAGLSEAAVARLRAERPDLEVDAGEPPAAEPLEIEPPVAVGAPAGALTPINALCPVSGKPVDPARLVVDEGRVIGFCCEKCPAQYWADPAAYRDKLP